MSRLFRFELDLLSEDPSIDYTQIIGKSVTISMTASGRYPPVLQRGYQPLWPSGRG